MSARGGARVRAAEPGAAAAQLERGDRLRGRIGACEPELAHSWHGGGPTLARPAVAPAAASAPHGAGRRRPRAQPRARQRLRQSSCARLSLKVRRRPPATGPSGGENADEPSDGTVAAARRRPRFGRRGSCPRERQSLSSATAPAAAAHGLADACARGDGVCGTTTRASCTRCSTAQKSSHKHSPRRPQITDSNDMLLETRAPAATARTIRPHERGRACRPPRRAQRRGWRNGAVAQSSYGGPLALQPHVRRRVQRLRSAPHAAENVVVSAAPPPTRGVVGLQNLGNTRFMNSVVQCPRTRRRRSGALSSRPTSSRRISTAAIRSRRDGAARGQMRLAAPPAAPCGPRRGRPVFVPAGPAPPARRHSLRPCPLSLARPTLTRPSIARAPVIPLARRLSFSRSLCRASAARLARERARLTRRAPRSAAAAPPQTDDEPQAEPAGVSTQARAFKQQRRAMNAMFGGVSSSMIRHELMSFIVDGLHEDLNRGSPRYVESAGINGRADSTRRSEARGARGNATTRTFSRSLAACSSRPCAAATRTPRAPTVAMVNSAAGDDDESATRSRRRRASRLRRPELRPPQVLCHFRQVHERLAAARVRSARPATAAHTVRPRALDHRAAVRGSASPPPHAAAPRVRVPKGSPAASLREGGCPRCRGSR